MRVKRTLGVLTVMALGVGITAYAYLQHPKFGSLPTADFRQSSNWVNGQFQNLEPDPVVQIDEQDRKGWVDLFFGPKNDRTPPGPVPSERTDLHSLDPASDIVVWMGHSSFYIQLAGKRILIDPVLSANASPVPLTNLPFVGSTPFTVEDIPDIDYLLISHDHWDHLDYPTVKALQDRIGTVIAGLGVGEHFRSWGFEEARIKEADWGSTITLGDEVTVHVLPARHYSGRGLKRNQSMWVSYALESTGRKLYFSGDSGYGKHFKGIGDTFGGFDLVLLDSGQYNEQWRQTHMMPEDAVQAADDLRAKAMLPAHIGKFSISFHPWSEPFNRLLAASEGKSWRLVTPLIGQAVPLEDIPSLSSWWKDVRSE